ncbi:MAG: Rieske (2Fe-2S) protein [Planctomycetota bacterium]
MERRGFLRWFTLLFGALCGGSGLVSLLGRRPQDGGWQVVAKPEEFEGQPALRVRLAVRAGWETAERPIYLVRDGEGIKALDARCTHLGCTVRFKEGEFRCPCHRGVFDAAGQPVSGPVSVPLPTLETRVQDGAIEVRA